MQLKGLTKGLLWLIRGYQLVISPMLPARCRFYPTCSSYALEAIRVYGGLKGGHLAIKRLCRCHPWGDSGVDFVPLPLFRYQYYYVSTPIVSQVIFRSARHGY